MEAQPAYPRSPSTQYNPVTIGVRILVFSKRCNHRSNQSSNKKLNTPSLAHRCCTGGANPSKVCASAASSQDGPRWRTAEPPLHRPPRGWWQPNGEISQGRNIRASFPLLAAHYGSDLWGSGLISVAGGNSGLHINYLMNAALFSVHESFMTGVQIWQKPVFSVSRLRIRWGVLSSRACTGCPLRLLATHSLLSGRSNNSCDLTFAPFAGWLNCLKPGVK